MAKGTLCFPDCHFLPLPRVLPLTSWAVTWGNGKSRDDGPQAGGGGQVSATHACAHGRLSPLATHPPPLFPCVSPQLSLICIPCPRRGINGRSFCTTLTRSFGKNKYPQTTDRCMFYCLDLNTKFDDYVTCFITVLSDSENSFRMPCNLSNFLDKHFGMMLVIFSTKSYYIHPERWRQLRTACLCQQSWLPGDWLGGKMCFLLCVLSFFSFFFFNMEPVFCFT